MGDIDFEEQLELERLEREKAEKEKQGPPGVKVDPDGTKYEWDPEKQAWFPKIDSDFIAQYQMNYGVSQEGEAAGADKQEQDYQNYYNYYQNYYQAAVQEEQVLTKTKKEKEGEDSHEEAVQKLANLENKMQSGEDLEALDTEQEYQSDSKEVMEKYTDEQKKQYNEYWSYYYNTEYHDYYTDCMTQEVTEGAAAGEGEKGGNKGQEGGDGKKKGKKRKNPQPKRDEGWFDVSEEHNTNVYVSGLPLDITMEEFTEMMTKYGLVMYDPRSKKPKLKLYMDENGQPKGDGRCCFIKKESVDLVLSLLDGAEHRGHTVKVDRATFTMKGNFDPTKKKKKLSNREKNKLRERQAKLFDWRPDKPRGARQKHEKVVVLKNVFDPKEFEDDPVKINVLKERMKTECSKYGEVKKVVAYDRHQDGIVMIHFSEAEEADMCIEYMNQRYLAKRRLLAATWDGKTKYEVEETEAEREARLKKWVDYLEDRDSSAADTNKTGDISGENSAHAGNGASTSTAVATGNGASVNTGVPTGNGASVNTGVPTGNGASVNTAVAGNISANVQSTVSDSENKDASKTGSEVGEKSASGEQVSENDASLEASVSMETESDTSEIGKSENQGNVNVTANKEETMVPTDDQT